jgi:hypothetical protein
MYETPVLHKSIQYGAYVLADMLVKCWVMNIELSFLLLRPYNMIFKCSVRLVAF